jgi:hypothetical protein
MNSLNYKFSLKRPNLAEQPPLDYETPALPPPPVSNGPAGTEWTFR